MAATASFVVYATADAIQLLARAMASGVTVCRSTYLRNRDADIASHNKVVLRLFQGTKNFCETLDQLLVESKGKHKVLLSLRKDPVSLFLDLSSGPFEDSPLSLPQVSIRGSTQNGSPGNQISNLAPSCFSVFSVKQESNNDYLFAASLLVEERLQFFANMWDSMTDHWVWDAVRLGYYLELHAVPLLTSSYVFLQPKAPQDS